MSVSPQPQDPVSIEELIDSLIEGREKLPVLPGRAAQVLRALRNEDIHPRKVADFVSKDPALAATMLRVANSAFYRGVSEVTDLGHALVRIGLGQARSIVFNVVMRSSLSGGDDFGATGKQVMDHSLAAALACRMIADVVDMDVEEAFLAGLLHDVGRMVLLDTLRRRGYEIDPPPENIKASLDGFHGEAGAALAGSWELPAVVASVARHHHDFAAAEEHRRMVAVVALADHICHAVDLGESDDPDDLDVHGPAAVLAVPVEKVLEIRAKLPELFAAASSAFRA